MSGLLADLVKIATESEDVARFLEYLSDDNPERFFYKRFSANTGIYDIKLDEWKAVVGANGSSIIEKRTEAYLNDRTVLDELKTAAVKPAEVYAQRQEHAEVPLVNDVHSQENIDLSALVVPIQPKLLKQYKYQAW